MAMIDATSNTPASILVLEAMCLKAGRSDIMEVFNIGKGPKVNVTMQINGVEVDALRTLTEAWERLESQYNEHLTEKAKELLSLAGLEKLQNTIQCAEWQIGEALEETLDKLNTQAK